MKRIIATFKISLFIIALLIYPSMVFALPDNLLLDENHGGDGSAWGNKHCDSCHLLNFIHQKTTVTLRNIVREKSYASCSGCHGNNGTDNKRQCIICHNSSDLPYASRQSGDNSHNFINPDQSSENLSLNDTNCLTCHSASNMNGVFELNIDLTLFKDKYGHKSVYKQSSEFCLACHNRDHQQAGFEMSQENYRDPLIAMEDNYHFIDKHGIAKGSGQRTYSGLRADYNYPAIVACTDCHAMHGTHNDKLIIANAYHGASGLSSQIKDQDISIKSRNGQFAQLCVICHDMDFLVEDADIDTGNSLRGVHQASGLCLECHRHGMAVQTGL
jgi:hypothetical protein